MYRRQLSVRTDHWSRGTESFLHDNGRRAGVCFTDGVYPIIGRDRIDPVYYTHLKIALQANRIITIGDGKIIKDEEMCIRDREIGVRMALGAKRSTIRMQFVIEAIVPVSYTHLDVYKRQVLLNR